MDCVSTGEWNNDRKYRLCFKIVIYWKEKEKISVTAHNYME